MIDPRFQIKKIKQTKEYGQFVIEPLERGYGHTLGNALRRVLLTSLPGAAITQVKIGGIRHKFSTLEGMKEDVIELILNLKQVRLSYAGKKPVKLTLEKSGPSEVKAGDIKTPASVEIVNQDHLLASLATKKDQLKMEMTVESGFGYLPVKEKKVEKIGLIPLDAAFSPVQRVNYQVEATRVGQRTDLDRLVLEIYTDGTVKPREALKQAAETLVVYFKQLVKPKKAWVGEKKTKVLPDGTLKLTVEELGLPTRVANALRRGGYGTAADLVAANSKDLAKVKNLGEKSIGIIREALDKKGISQEGQ